MSLPIETLNMLSGIIAQDAALRGRLQQAADPVQAATLIAQAAADRGTTIDAQVLASHFTAQPGMAAIGDDQLAAIAGGSVGSPLFPVNSIPYMVQRDVNHRYSC